jgi:hypothetical protein
LEEKNDLYNFFAESQLFASRQKFVPSVFSLPRVFLIALGKEASLPNVVSLSGVFIWLSAKPSWPGVFYLALDKEPSSRQSL